MSDDFKLTPADAPDGDKQHAYEESQRRLVAKMNEQAGADIRKLEAKVQWLEGNKQSLLSSGDNHPLRAGLIAAIAEHQAKVQAQLEVQKDAQEAIKKGS